MGLSASQGRLLLLTARQSDLEYRAQQISHKRLVLSQQLDDIAKDYEDSTSNRQMMIALHLAGENEDGKLTSISKNLTYANLISGALDKGEAISGIKRYSRTEKSDYTSSVAYRLVDVDGAIVVSDVSEIPTVNTTVKKNEKTAEEALDDNNNPITNLFESKNTKADGTSSSTFSVFAKEGTALYKALEEAVGGKDRFNKEKSTSKVKLDANKTMVKVGSKYYDIKTGAEKTGVTSFTEGEDATLVASKNLIPKSTIETNEVTDTECVVGNDGTYTLYTDSSKKTIKARYRVDPGLKYNSNEPTYLQDCLRNGKYLLERLDTNTEDNEFKWKSISWDATSNISDQYYQNDDDTAKAKYDRQQSQIQTQDKKLEIELDNVESQRSAVKTETESVEKVINDNIEKSFKTFNA